MIDTKKIIFREVLEELCLNLENAISQRKTELGAGLGTKGTMGYEIVGCYACDGYNMKCLKYESIKTLREYK